MKSTIRQIILLLIIVVTAGCSSGDSTNQASSAISAYLQALAAKDVNQMIALSCASWEPQARLEFDSFGAVGIALEDLNCQDSGDEGEARLVSCTGQIIASYGTEDLIIDLSERTYRAQNEAGEWRMCGYQ
jgi:hypothetical protein